jgi:4a-hydroxytetrahydrobiopterin dehydratase
MSSPTRLTSSDIQTALAGELPQWTLENDAFVRTFPFPAFLRAVEFVNSIAHLAERQDHHPDIDIRYRNVTLRYWTHTAQGVTALDIAGAKAASQIFTQLKRDYPPAFD